METRATDHLKCKLIGSITHIELEILKQSESKDYKEQFYLFKKQRKRNETLFFQLYDPLMKRRNYAKRFEGFKTRLLAKITAFTVVQFINKTYFNRNINNLDVSII